MCKGNSTWFIALIWITCSLFGGCHTDPSYREDSDYRIIERDVQRTGTELALTGADITAVVKKVGSHATQVQEVLEGLEASIQETNIADAEKETLLGQVSRAQVETAALNMSLGEVNEDVERLNTQLAEQRRLNEALAEEHDNRETAGATVKADLVKVKADLVKVKGQRNLSLTILIAVCVGVLGYFYKRRGLNI
jgi:chromosome segregation ATPase